MTILSVFSFERIGDRMMTFTVNSELRDKRRVVLPEDGVARPPDEHVRRSNFMTAAVKGTGYNRLATYEIPYELYGLADPTVYTRHWFIAVEQPRLGDFLNRQTHFLKSQSERNKAILSGYTYYGAQLFNTMLRSRAADISELIRTIAFLTYPTALDYAIYEQYAVLHANGLKLPPKSDILKDGEIQHEVIKDIMLENIDWFKDFRKLSLLIRYLYSEFMKIFLKAPRPTVPFTVYRGVRTEHTDTLTYTSTDFWSTSLDPTVTNTFVQPDTGCCVYEIRINPGIPVLFLEPITQFTRELEILLPPGIEYTSSNEVVIKEIYREPGAIQQTIAVIEMTAERFDSSLATYDHLTRVWASERREAGLRLAKSVAKGYVRISPTRSAKRHKPKVSHKSPHSIREHGRTRKLKKWSRGKKYVPVSNE